MLNLSLRNRSLQQLRIYVPLFLALALIYNGASHAFAETIQAKVLSTDGVHWILDTDPPKKIEVQPADASIDYSKKHVRGVIEKGKDGKLFLTHIFPDDPIEKQIVKNVSLRLSRETLIMKTSLAIKDYVPDFALYDQQGRLIRKNEFRDDYWILNFIFTRCKVAAMCPASTSRMVTLGQMIKKQNIKNVRLVTITLDPDYDSPGILNQYAKDRGIDFDQHLFLTGDVNQIKDLLTRFGLLTKISDGTINHTMATFLIGPNGRILFRKPGSNWTVAEFFDRLELLTSQ